MLRHKFVPCFALDLPGGSSSSLSLANNQIDNDVLFSAEWACELVYLKVVVKGVSVHDGAHPTQSLRCSCCFIADSWRSKQPSLLAQKIVQQEDAFLPSTTAMVAPVTATVSVLLAAEAAVVAAAAAACGLDSVFTGVLEGAEAGAADC